MAKRTRGSNRPGQRHSDKRGSARPQSQIASRPAGALSPSEETHAAALESEIIAQDRAAEIGRNRAKNVDRGFDAVRPGRSAGPGLLAARAAEEYAYVVRDVRRIVLVGGALVVTLGILYVLIDIAHVVTIS